MRIREFLRINHPNFTGSSTTMNLKNIVDELMNVFDMMHVVDVETI